MKRTRAFFFSSLILMSFASCGSSIEKEDDAVGSSQMSSSSQTENITSPVVETPGDQIEMFNNF